MASVRAFSEKEKEDLHELFRIYDFAKVSKVDSVVEEAAAKAITPEAYFDDMFKLYRIERLPNRDDVKVRMREAVPDASPEDIESVLRLTEMRRFAEKDAIRSLERLYKVAARTSRPPSRPAGTPPQAMPNVAVRLHAAPPPPRNAEAPDQSPTHAESQEKSVTTAKESPKAAATAASSRRVSYEESSPTVLESNDVSATNFGPQPPALAAFQSAEDKKQSGKDCELRTSNDGKVAPEANGTTDEPALSSHPSLLQEAISNLRHVPQEDEVGPGGEYGSAAHIGAGMGSYRRVLGPSPYHSTAALGTTGANIDAGKSMNGDLTRSMSQLSTTFSRQVVDEVMAEEVREWVAKLVGAKYNSEVLSSPKFVDSLRNGVVLHVLLQKMENPPVPDEKLKVPKRATGFFARDNVSSFLAEAKRRYNLLDAQMFNNSDLCDCKDDRQVVTCLMAMARMAYSQGAIQIAPTIVMLEKEIEAHATKLTPTEIERIVQEAELKEQQRENTTAEGRQHVEETTKGESKGEPTGEATTADPATRDTEEVPQGTLSAAADEVCEQDTSRVGTANTREGNEDRDREDTEPFEEIVDEDASDKMGSSDDPLTERDIPCNNATAPPTARLEAASELVVPSPPPLAEKPPPQHQPRRPPHPPPAPPSFIKEPIVNESSLSEHGVLLADGEAPEEREDTRKEQEEALSPTEQSSAVEALSSFEEQEPKGASARTLPPLSARTSSTKDPSTASRPPTATVNNSTSRSGSSPTKAEGKSAVAVRSEEKPRLLPKPESVKSPKKTEAKEVKDAAAPKIEAAQRNVTQQPESDEKPAASAPVDTQEAHPPAAAIVAPSDAENAEPPANQTTGVDLDEIDANGIFVKRKGEWDSRIEEDKHANDKPEPRSDAPKQKVTRVVWKVPVKDAANNNGQPPVYRSRRWDGIDVALGNILNEYYQNHPASPWRFHAIAANAGEYVMYNRDSAQKRVVFVRFVQRKLFIRYSQGPSGPEWVMFADAVKRLDEMFAKQQQDPAY